MQASKLIAGVVSVGLVAGAALALDKSGAQSMTAAREAICASASLTDTDKTDCKTLMKSASSETEKQQIATRYRSKADMREFRESITTASATTQPVVPSTPAVKK